MSLIDQRVAAARRRLWINRYLQYLGTCLLWAGLAWLIAVLVQKIAIHNLPLHYAALGAAGLAALAAMVWLILTGEDPITAAVALDQAGSVKERLSSALYLRRSADPFSQAAVADAERTAAMLQVRNVLPVRYPRRVNHAVIGWVAALLVLWLLPTIDVTGKLQATQKKQEEIRKQQEIVAKKVEQIQKAREQLQKNGKPDSELAKKLDERLENLTNLAQQPDKMPGVEAMKQVTDLKDEVRQQQKDLQKQAEAMQAALAKMALASMDSEGKVSEFSKALASGDFKQSKAALQQLQQEIQQASKDPAKAAQLAKQLETLSKALKNQSMPESLNKELKAAGLNKEQMDKLADAMKNGKPLTEAQKQQLQQAMKDQGLSDQQAGEMMKKIANALKASEMASKLGQSMADAAAEMKQKGEGKQGSGQQGQPGNQDQQAGQPSGNSDSAQEPGEGQMAAAGEQLGEMEAMQTELQSMQALMADLQGQPSQGGQGQGQEGEGNQGQGTGNSGRQGSGMGQGGAGGLRETTHTPTALSRTKADTKWRNGKIVGEYFEDGKQVKGESRSELVDVVAAAERDAAKTIDEHKLPPQYDGPVGEYFRQLRQVSDQKAK